MTHTYLSRKTLGNKDKNILLENKVTEKIKDTIHLVYYGKLTYTPKGCKNWGGYKPFTLFESIQSNNRFDFALALNKSQGSLLKLRI